MEKQKTPLQIAYSWIRYSGVWITVIVNPLHWSIRFENIFEDELNPKMNYVNLQFLFLNIKIILDDGSW
jgi:hypothetical protein